MPQMPRANQGDAMVLSAAGGGGGQLPAVAAALGLASCVLAPALEEAVYRGVVLDALLAARWSAPAAVGLRTLNSLP